MTMLDDPPEVATVDVPPTFSYRSWIHCYDSLVHVHKAVDVVLDSFHYRVVCNASRKRGRVSKGRLEGIDSQLTDLIAARVAEYLYWRVALFPRSHVHFSAFKVEFERRVSPLELELHELELISRRVELFLNHDAVG